MGRKVGIDLGTTNSVVAVLDGPEPRVVDNKENKSETKSMVSLRKRFGAGRATQPEMLVGSYAYDNWEFAPQDTINSIKRLMGRGVSDPEVEKVKKWAYYGIVAPSDGTERSISVLIDGKEYSPEDISAMILRKLKEDAEDRLNEDITHAVITVPAYFSQTQRAATRDAAHKAGLRVIKILDEPSAAAVAYGIENENAGDAKTILVYDLGGGTFDISIMMCSGQAFACLNKEGDMWLGGDDFDQVIIDRVVEYIEQEYAIDPRKDKKFMVALRKKARDAKEQLSGANSAPILLPGQLKDDSGNLIPVEFDITRSDFEGMIRPLVARTVVLAVKALRGASLIPENVGLGQWEEIFERLAGQQTRPSSSDISPKEWDKAFEWLDTGAGPQVTSNVEFVLLAGNATRIPMVRATVEKLFGKDKVKRDMHPKNCVAMGAALMAVRNDGWFCVAPHPEDPEKPCDEFNDADSAVCKRCGAEVALDMEIEPPVLEPIISAGGAPFDYGMQTVGDVFNVFVRKNDPVPTPSADRTWRPFRTQIPNQRMVSTPVFGGENAEKASANEFQGKAFALLPPGLPQDTIVRVKIWLDADGVFDLDMTLGDGSPVQYQLLRGEADAKAVEALELMEKRYKEAAGRLTAQELVRAEEERDEIFDLWAKRDYAGATAKARVFPEPLAVKKQLRNALSWDEDWVRRYGWAMDPNKVYTLNNLIEEAKNALDSHDPDQIQSALERLNSEDRDFGTPLANALTYSDFKIGTLIRTHNPVMATKLQQELGRIEAELRQGSDSAIPAFNEFWDRLQAEIGIIDGTTHVEEKCKCGRPRKGPVCECGHDWTLVDR